MAHGDYTGQTKARLAQTFAEQQQLAAQTSSMVTTAVREGQRDTVIDLRVDRDYENLQPRPQEGADGEVTEVDVTNPMFNPVKFRASEDLEQVTVGQGREFSLKAGHTYLAPKWVVQHLDAQGLVYH